MKKNFKTYVALFLLVLTLIGKPIITHAAVNSNAKVTNFDSVSGPMTFEQMIRYYAQVAECSYEEALLNFSKTSAMNSKSSDTYRILSVILDVDPGYKPKIDFYCETSESGSYWGILSVYSVQLDRRYSTSVNPNLETTKQFNGSIDTWLRNAYTIEYIINGDFFNNGTTSVTGEFGAEIGIGESAKVTYGASVTVTSNHYKYFYYSERKRFQ